MNAITFYNKFKEATGNVDIAIYGANKLYTNYVLDKVKGIIKEEYYNYSSEYYRVDVTGWTQRKEEIRASAENVKMFPYLWDLEIAVEHENSHKDWFDELVKLAHLRCPLKVVISYNSCDFRDDEKYGDLAILKVAAETLNKVKAFKNADNEEFLVILGNSSKAVSNSPDYETPDYRGYVYNGEEFKKI